MQGDRTFDNYFGSYPGADGLPAAACQAVTPGQTGGSCVKPYPLHGTTPGPLEPGNSTVKGLIFNLTAVDAIRIAQPITGPANPGGVTIQGNFIGTNATGGRMDGVVSAYTAQSRDGTTAMGYYDDRDLSYYWGLAQRYVLFDQFFSSVPFGYRANRSYWVSAAAQPGGTDRVPVGGYGDQATIFDRLEAAGVTWKFYVQDYQPDETFRSITATNPATQTVRVPLLNYPRFVDDPVLKSHIADLDQYYRDLANGTLPAVAYVATSGASERSARSIPTGQNLVRNMVTQLQLSRYWRSSAFMWSYDGSGGWYDHVTPPAGLGLRVPALLVSPYARPGQVNHTTLDSTAALRFIENNWNVAALTARDAAAGDLGTAFDFRTRPRPAEVFAGDTAATHGPLVHVGVIYLYYGGAVALVLLLLAVAAVAPRRRRVGRPGPAAAAGSRSQPEPTQEEVSAV